MDYTADTQALGKTIGADLKEGKLTLPVIYSLDKANPEDRQWMSTLIQRMNFSDDEFQRLVRLLHQYGGIRYGQEVALQHVSQAKNIMESFLPSETRDTLTMIAEYTLKRKS